MPRRQSSEHKISAKLSVCTLKREAGIHAAAETVPSIDRDTSGYRTSIEAHFLVAGRNFATLIDILFPIADALVSRTRRIPPSSSIPVRSNFAGETIEVVPAQAARSGDDSSTLIGVSPRIRASRWTDRLIACRLVRVSSLRTKIFVINLSMLHYLICVVCVKLPLDLMQVEPLKRRRRKT